MESFVVELHYYGTPSANLWGRDMADFPLQ